MLKIIKKILIILLIIIMETLFFVYRILSKFWEKHNIDIRNIANNLSNELKRTLNNT